MPGRASGVGAYLSLAFLVLLGAGPTGAEALRAQVPCDPDDGGLELPDGFCATVVAEDVGRARHVAVAPNGDLYVALRSGRESSAGGVLALRDTDGDGRADRIERVYDRHGGTGIALHDGHLYFGADDRILRWPRKEGELVPSGEPETIVRDLPDERSHRAKPVAFDGAGHLFVNVGSPSNACQEQSRSAGSPGRDPCPELETRAGIWRFDADRTGQTQADGVHWATGLRNTVALTVHPTLGEPYGVVHGRDQLHTLWPDLFTPEQSAHKPSEELFRIGEGTDGGWPYCYHDPETGEKVLAPEYGGDGEEIGRCAGKDDPLLAFPAHWAPNALHFYTGEQFPERYRGGVFVAFHGSWNRAPLPQAGYQVVFVPFAGDEPSSGEWEEFATGFREADQGPRTADHRPTGLAEGPDGSLYVTDDQAGTIWRIRYRGDRAGRE